MVNLTVLRFITCHLLILSDATTSESAPQRFQTAEPSSDDVIPGCRDVLGRDSDKCAKGGLFANCSSNKPPSVACQPCAEYVRCRASHAEAPPDPTVTPPASNASITTPKGTTSSLAESETTQFWAIVTYVILVVGFVTVIVVLLWFAHITGLGKRLRRTRARKTRGKPVESEEMVVLGKVAEGGERRRHRRNQETAVDQRLTEVPSIGHDESDCDGRNRDVSNPAKGHHYFVTEGDAPQGSGVLQDVTRGHHSDDAQGHALVNATQDRDVTDSGARPALHDLEGSCESIQSLDPVRPLDPGWVPSGEAARGQTGLIWGSSSL